MTPFQDGEAAVHKKTDNILPDDYQPDLDADDIEPEIDSLETETAGCEVGESDCLDPDDVKDRATADVQVLNSNAITACPVICLSRHQIALEASL